MPSNDTPICAKCHEVLHVAPGLEWNDGDLCYICQGEELEARNSTIAALTAELAEAKELNRLATTKYDGVYSYETKPNHTCAEVWWYWYKHEGGVPSQIATVQRDKRAQGGYWVHWPPPWKDGPVALAFTKVLWGPPVCHFDGEMEHDQRHRIVELEQQLSTTRADAIAEGMEKAAKYLDDQAKLYKELRGQRAVALDESGAANCAVLKAAAENWSAALRTPPTPAETKGAEA